MAKKTADQRLSDLKLKTTGEILDFYQSFIRRFNSKSLEMLELVQSSRVDLKNETDTVNIKMSRKNYDNLYAFFREGQEDDLVSNGADNYTKEQCQEMRLKEKLLEELDEE